jgi:predicted NUDIX family NTP pyrophosphohydrolase
VGESAGILLFRGAGEETEVLLVHPGGPYWRGKDEGAWSIPKGECEPGEDRRACALRELAEELGPSAPTLDLEALIGLGSVRQRAGKVVHAWAAEAGFDPERLSSATFSMEWPPRSGAEREFPEVDRAEWMGSEAARARINQAQAELLDRLRERLGERPRR